MYKNRKINKKIKTKLQLDLFSEIKVESSLLNRGNNRKERSIERTTITERLLNFKLNNKKKPAISIFCMMM